MNKSLFIKLILSLLILSTGVSFAFAKGNTQIDSFSKSKKILLKLYKRQGKQVTFYCGCSYTGKTVDHGSCGYKPKRPFYKSGKVNKRAHRIEWEHVVPAHAFAKSFPEYKAGCKRKCLKKNNPAFARMEADLYNLVPAIGEVNGNRSNYSMAMISGEKRKYGQCDVEIEKRKVEPRPEVRGNVARTYMYMNWAYPGRGIISKKNRKLFEAWSKADPVDQWECKRAKLIKSIQGNENPFVMEGCR